MILNGLKMIMAVKIGIDLFFIAVADFIIKFLGLWCNWEHGISSCLSPSEIGYAFHGINYLCYLGLLS